MSSILVTGGCGFIGANLVPMLCERGHDISILDNFSRGSIDYLDTPDNYTVIDADIRNENAVTEAAEGKDVIIHLAAYGSVVASVDNPIDNFSVNAQGTFNVLNAASLGSAYEFTDATGVAVTGDYQLEGNVLTSKNTDNEVHVSITMLNKNSFDARDLQVTFILAGERSYSTFQDLDRSEESSAIYKVEIPNNLETGKYALQVIIENDDIYNEEFINLEIESLGDVVVIENPEDNKKSFWQSLWDLF